MRQQNRAMRRKMVINIQVEFMSVEHNLLQALFHHECVFCVYRRTKHFYFDMKEKTETSAAALFRETSALKLFWSSKKINKNACRWKSMQYY